MEEQNASNKKNPASASTRSMGRQAIAEDRTYFEQALIACQIENVYRALPVRAVVMMMPRLLPLPPPPPRRYKRQESLWRKPRSSGKHYAPTVVYSPSKHISHYESITVLSRVPTDDEPPLLLLLLLLLLGPSSLPAGRQADRQTGQPLFPCATNNRLAGWLAGGLGDRYFYPKIPQPETHAHTDRRTDRQTHQEMEA